MKTPTTWWETVNTRFVADRERGMRLVVEPVLTPNGGKVWQWSVWVPSTGNYAMGIGVRMLPAGAGRRRTQRAAKSAAEAHGRLVLVERALGSNAFKFGDDL